jgi:Tfp pilus assembly protein PilF
MAKAWNRRAWVHVEYLGTQLDAAMEWAGCAVKLATHARDDRLQAAALDTLGWAGYKHGMLDAAEKYLTKCLRLAPNADIVHDHLRAVRNKQRIDH